MFGGPRPCYVCDGRRVWRLSEAHGWVCGVCHPPNPSARVEWVVCEPQAPRAPMPTLPDYQKAGEEWRMRRRLGLK